MIWIAFAIDTSPFFILLILIKFILSQSELKANDKRLGVIHTHAEKFSYPAELISSPNFILLNIGSDAKTVGQGLFAALRGPSYCIDFLLLASRPVNLLHPPPALTHIVTDLDQRGVSLIIMEGISEEAEGLAVMNRIRKAASRIEHL